MSSYSADPAHLIPANQRLRRSRRFWRLMFLLMLLLAILALSVRILGAEGAVLDHVARVSITGTVTTDPAREAMLQQLADDEHVKAVIVAINSPGGTTAGGEELYESLSLIRAKKPVVAVISELGASAAYMTAIASDRIFARRLSIVGSIGVLYQHVNAGKLLDTIGLDFDKVQTGPLKAEPDIDEPLAGAPRVELQGLVDDSFQWFVDIVAERRGLDRNTVLGLADGRILTGRQALTAKLIDATGGEREAVAWLESEKAVPKDLHITDVWPEPETGWGGLSRWLGQSARSAIGLPEGPMALDGLISLWQAEPKT